MQLNNINFIIDHIKENQIKKNLILLQLKWILLKIIQKKKFNKIQIKKLIKLIFIECYKKLFKF